MRRVLSAHALRQKQGGNRFGIVATFARPALTQRTETIGHRMLKLRQKFFGDPALHAWQSPSAGWELAAAWSGLWVKRSSNRSRPVRAGDKQQRFSPSASPSCAPDAMDAGFQIHRQIRN